ncbi:MAG: SurA N-terminal domain-containing protein [Sphingomonadales bacterium]|nr:SurA N-terminal domain-containing protein [Sphingomonadales bacterium]
MLELFRKFFNSTLGIGLTLGLVGLIALAFAAADISSSNSFGGIGGGDRVATVGGQKISTSELSKALSSGLDQARRENPQVTMRAFVAGGGLRQVLDAIVDRTAIAEFGRDHGIIAGKRLVDSELTKIPGLQGLDGKFSEATYRQLLAQRQLTDAEVRGDIAQGLVARQVLTPAQYGAVLPGDLIARYAGLLKERRTGMIASLPSALFAPRTAPGDAELAGWYASHRNAFIRPERRVIRWATFGDAALKPLPAPTDAEIAARYEANKAQFAASETRTFTQLVLPTEAAARALLAEVAGGKAFDAAARAKGLATASVGPVARPAYAEQTSAAVADAAFAAPKGKLVGPVKAALGWQLVRVDAIETRAARSLDQVKGELAAQITTEKRRKALADLAARIEDEFDKSGALSDAAKELGVTLQQTPALTADGKVYGAPDGKVAPEVGKVVQAAFAMEREQEPQLAEIEPGKTFVIFDVNRIDASAPAPLAEIKSDVVAAYQMEKGATAARAAALKVLDAAKHGKDLPAALASLGVPLPAPTPVSMDRQQLMAAGNGRVPPVLGLLFSMAQGTTKLLPAPRNAGWMVVQLKAIAPGAVAAGDPLIGETARELGQMAGSELVDAMRLAVRAEVGVKRNETAIRAVTAQATGGQ